MDFVTAALHSTITGSRPPCVRLIPGSILFASSSPYPHPRTATPASLCPYVLTGNTGNRPCQGRTPCDPTTPSFINGYPQPAHFILVIQSLRSPQMATHPPTRTSARALTHSPSLAMTSHRSRRASWRQDTVGW